MQRYSIENQLDVIGEYAKERGLEVVETYQDGGISGLTMKNRTGLRRLLEDVMAGRAQFRTLLVLDVSRWGRFQDTDEAAHYEFLCRSNGVRVVYCGEDFENDGSFLATVAKTLKRGMAAEYSRELSKKVFRGQVKGARLGFHQGSSAAVGLRRQMISPTGTPMFVMETGERKALQGARTIIVPGPPDEVELIRSMFRMFVEEDLSIQEMVRRFKRDGITMPNGQPLLGYSMGQMLRNERYIGNLLYNRVTQKLGRQRIPNPPDAWIRVEGAYEPIIDADLFQRAQEKFAHLTINTTDDDLLDRLRTYVEKHGVVSNLRINADQKLPWASAYQDRFGSLSNAYKLIGYEPPQASDEEVLDQLRAYLRKHGRLKDTDFRKGRGLPPRTLIKSRFGSLSGAYAMIGYVPKRYNHTAAEARTLEKREAIIAEIIDRVRGRGGEVTLHRRTCVMRINGVSVVVAAGSHRYERGTKLSFWRYERKTPVKSDFMLCIRMRLKNEVVKDYFLLPKDEVPAGTFHLRDKNGPSINRHRLQTLDAIYDLRRTE